MKPITLPRSEYRRLPLSARSYIDHYADEYKRADNWTKLTDIAYLLKRGVNLLPKFIEDINDHLDVYRDYEDIAKQSIAYYIELLRSGSKYGTSSRELHDKMSFQELFQLMSEEILYRYWEHNTRDGRYVECGFDDVHFDYDEIASRYKGSDNPKRDFIRYIKTSKETLRNIEVTESSIWCKNGWKLVADKLDTMWSDKEEDERIYPGDENFVHQFNTKNASAYQYQYIVGVPPMPFSGNLLDAKVVILTLNPGYVEEINKDWCQKLQDGPQKRLVFFMKGALCFFNDAIYDDDDNGCSRIQGDRYWEKSFAKLALEAYGKPSTEVGHPIYHDIAFLQLVGYHSEKFKDSAGIRHIPSMLFTNLLVKYLATKTDKTFLILRSERRWKEVFGDELWEQLSTQGRIITKGHKGMSQAITRGNIKDGGFDRLVDILKA